MPKPHRKNDVLIYLTPRQTKTVLLNMRHLASESVDASYRRSSTAIVQRIEAALFRAERPVRITAGHHYRSDAARLFMQRSGFFAIAIPMTKKILDYALVLLVLAAIAFVAYQMFGPPLPPDPNAPQIVEPNYRNQGR